MSSSSRSRGLLACSVVEFLDGSRDDRVPQISLKCDSHSFLASVVSTAGRLRRQAGVNDGVLLHVVSELVGHVGAKEASQDESSDLASLGAGVLEEPMLDSTVFGEARNLPAALLDDELAQRVQAVKEADESEHDILDLLSLGSGHGNIMLLGDGSNLIKGEEGNGVDADLSTLQDLLGRRATIVDVSSGV